MAGTRKVTKHGGCEGDRHDGSTQGMQARNLGELHNLTSVHLVDRNTWIRIDFEILNRCKSIKPSCCCSCYDD